MRSSDRDQILKLLADSHQALLAVIAGVPEEHARIRPASDQWSVLDCVEHVAIAEFGMFTMLTTNLTPTPPSGDRGREEIFLHGSANRTRKFNAPERARPKGRFPSLAAALNQFQQNRASTIDYVKLCDKEMRAHSVPHPVLGRVTGQDATPSKSARSADLSV